MTIFAIFLLFLPNGWLLTPVDDGTKCLACWNRFMIVRVSIRKKRSKQRFLQKIVEKNRKNVEFCFAFSSHLITIDMCCKGQLRDQVAAIGCRFIKTRKKFNFFQKNYSNFWKFLQKMKKFWNFSKSKNRKFSKFLFGPKTYFSLSQGPN